VGLKRGTVFEHTRWLNEKRDGGLLCRVTRVARGVVYWRPLDGGTPMKFGIEEAANYVKEIVSE
jgi:hypothetical protein